MFGVESRGAGEREEEDRVSILQRTHRKLLEEAKAVEQSASLAELEALSRTQHAKAFRKQAAELRAAAGRVEALLADEVEPDAKAVAA